MFSIQRRGFCLLSSVFSSLLVLEACTGKETLLREIVEDTMDWLTARCGMPVDMRAPRSLRQAVRRLGSANATQRARAEADLLRAHPGHVTPLLRQTARSRPAVSASVRAALLLHQMRDRQGAELVRHLAHDPGARTGEYGEQLRRAACLTLSPQPYIQQASASLARLEQRPDSFAAIVRFRQAGEMLRFLRAPLPAPLLDRALVVRTVGGENLSLVREVLKGTPGPSIEHVCLARREAVLLLLYQTTPDEACTRLMQTLAHPSPAVQLTTLYGIAELDDPRALDALLPIAADERSLIRDEAQELIARLSGGSPDVLTLLRPGPAALLRVEEMLRPALPQNDDPETLLRTGEVVHRETRKTNEKEIRKAD